jgi:hypothetical protein
LPSPIDCRQRATSKDAPAGELVRGVRVTISETSDSLSALRCEEPITQGLCETNVQATAAAAQFV